MANSFYFVIWATLFRAFGQQFTEKLSKPFSKCSDNILWKQIFSNLSCFLCIILLWAQIFWDLAEIFPQSDKVFYGSRRRLWWKTLFLINSPFLDLGRNFFWLSAKIFEKSCQNCFLRVHETFWRKKFIDFFVFGTYLDFERKFPYIWLKIFHKVDKTAFWRFKPTLWRKTFLKNFSIFWTLVETFSDFREFFSQS